MRKIYLAILTFIPLFPLFSQNLYFPPIIGDEWETIEPSTLDWCDDRINDLYQFLEEKNTRAFLILKDGKIVLEKYFNGHDRDSLWYWASAGKSVTATLVGIAQEEGLLDINEPVSNYLGTGWTQAPAEKEDLITVWHQLTMTTGLDDGVSNSDCTDPECLLYLQDAGTRWAYHNAPYTRIDGALENASNQNFNLFYYSRLANKTGMGGLWAYLGYNHVLFSKARSMARFGLLLLNNGYWANTPVLTDTDYLQSMVNTSQDLNKAYGYLWWLNGKESYQLPGLPINIPGFICPDAPADMYAAMGKNGQYINVVPSQGLVLVRMGEAPDDLLVPNLLNNEIWQYVNELTCETTATSEDRAVKIHVFPNPVIDFLEINLPTGNPDFSIRIFNAFGQLIIQEKNNPRVLLTDVPGGIYFYEINMGKELVTGIFQKKAK